MKGIDVTNEFAQEILASKSWKNQGIKVNLTESTEPVKTEDSQEEVLEEEVEVHSCPLCESTLEEPLSKEKIDEHVSTLLDILNESFDLDGDTLEEATEEAEEDDNQ